MKRLVILGSVLSLIGLSSAIAWSVLDGAKPSTAKKIFASFEEKATKAVSDIPENQAVDIAKNVLAKTGTSLAVPSYKKLKKVPLFSQSRIWSIEFGQDGEVDIDAEQGRIVRLVNNKMINESSKVKGTIDASQAKDKALEHTKALKLDIGNTGGDPEISIIDFGIPAWLVEFPRVYHDIPYAHDAVYFQISTIDGALLGYAYTYPSDEPQSVEVSLNEESARSIAAQFMKTTESDLSKPGELMIVNPNYYWTDEFNPDPVSEAAVAWVFVLESGSQVWVSVQDGAILGGVLVGHIPPE